MNNASAILQINQWAKNRQPFLFVIDYECQKPVVLPLDEAASAGIFYDFNGQTNSSPPIWQGNKPFFLQSFPINFTQYQQAFAQVQAHLHRGDSFLTNLTQPTPIQINLSLAEIFARSQAKYRLLFKDEFVCFSPEIFVKIEGQTIATHPMKGTIDAQIVGANELILNDIKEKSEHTTIVDLLRNDLSMICDKVWVERFRYVERLSIHTGELLQVSSEIRGILPANFRENLGELLFKLLPAGSICGAPKPQTLRIIKTTEGYQRGYYSGVCGIYDGENLDSGVMIRFIEKTADGYVFKSGGGITTRSNAMAEYQEMIKKVYVPI